MPFKFLAVVVVDRAPRVRLLFIERADIQECTAWRVSPKRHATCTIRRWNLSNWEYCFTCVQQPAKCMSKYNCRIYRMHFSQLWSLVGTAWHGRSFWREPKRRWLLHKFGQWSMILYGDTIFYHVSKAGSCFWSSYILPNAMYICVYSILRIQTQIMVVRQMSSHILIVDVWTKAN